MATTNLLAFVLLISISLNTSAGAPVSPPLHLTLRAYPKSLLATVLSTLGYEELAAATADANFSSVTPTTVFAPTYSSLITCPSCSIPLILQEHSLRGLYSLHFLRELAFGTKIGTFAPNRCLTVTSSATSLEPSSVGKIFINGVEITKPDLFNNGLLIIHGLQGFISHLSPFSCSIERMTSLSFPQQPPPASAFFMMRQMLKDSMTRLRVSGYSIVALGMRVTYPDLSVLESLTLFAIDDVSIFSGGGGHSYVSKLRFHVVPNRILTAADLFALPKGTALPTMESGQNLVVTNSGSGSPLAPLRINYVKMKQFDLVHNSRIAIHGMSTPFRHVYYKEM
ncbi:putative fasciclin-like arabinogalactan protein 20 [Primulina tabacum]|uniref:putative fasciclin-like arabinogalactan protein 20 n=1 Tax=Primulina tabacum TaxID=48773 RepID=UPI003F5920D5